MGLNKRIRPCPQHAGGATPERPAYLLRTCPACMGWLASHPEDARLARQFVPGSYASPLQGGYNRHADTPRLTRAAALRDQKRRESVPPRFAP